MKVTWLAVCRDCPPSFVPMSFDLPELRDQWVSDHEYDGHHCEVGFEVRDE